MGYTHYWSNDDIDPKKWVGIKKDAERLIAASPTPVQYEDDDATPPLVTDEQIRFNGVGDDGHETFLFDRRASNFEFCKTARKPYDILVASILNVAKTHDPQISVRSDGDLDDEEWIDALAFASKTLGREIPFLVEKD